MGKYMAPEAPNNPFLSAFSLAGILPGRRVILTTLILAPFLTVTLAHAADPLTWEACARETRANNPQLRTARYRLETSRLQRSSALGGFLPRMDVSGGMDGSGGKPYFGRYEPGYSSKLAVTQPLFSGFSTVAELDRAGAAFRVEEARFRSTEAEVRHRLRKAYTTVMLAQENVQVRALIARRRSENLELVKKVVAAKKGEDSSVQQAEAEVGKAEFEVSKGKRALIRAQQRVSREMGREKFTPMEVTVDWTAQPPPSDPAMEELAEAVPGVREVAAGVTQAESELVEARSVFWPSVDAHASVYRDGPDWPPTESRGWILGAYVSYNLFSGMKDWVNLRVAVNGINEAKEELVIARRSALEALEEALSPYADAYESVAVQKQSLDAARSRAEDSRKGYSEGSVEFDQWNEVESGLVEAETGFIEARKEALDAEADWLLATGAGLP